MAAAAAHKIASGDLLTPMEIDRQLATFREHFSRAVLQQIDGEPLLYLMHGRQDRESRCLTYWLEFKNDEEFAGNRLAVSVVDQRSNSESFSVKTTGRALDNWFTNRTEGIVAR